MARILAARGIPEPIENQAPAAGPRSGAARRPGGPAPTA